MDGYFFLFLLLGFAHQERKGGSFTGELGSGYGPREARVGMDAGAIGVAGTTATGSQTAKLFIES
ncbi:NAD-dependent epimerase/dehydratase isoform X1 [Iris pallida]|uniref:NAD-dependent epimerase/dehydratase isoform X1 n=1 Tax=Iris pallida TaxID=29817 RepID=A0AAX6GQI3_IRIPA|nr:NAD-dependent epimerase/dehydratase isoform X1 [Iris pallida]